MTKHNMTWSNDYKFVFHDDDDDNNEHLLQKKLMMIIVLMISDKMAKKWAVVRLSNDTMYSVSFYYYSSCVHNYWLTLKGRAPEYNFVLLSSLLSWWNIFFLAMFMLVSCSIREKHDYLVVISQ